MALIISDTVNRQEDKMKKGKLIRVELQPGRFVKMYEQDAIDQGLITAPKQQKMKPAQENKMVQPAEVKTKPLPQSEPDDFSEINGIGKATSRAIVANGLETFAALRAAGDLSFLTPSAQTAVEKWRDE